MYFRALLVSLILSYTAIAQTPGEAFLAYEKGEYDNAAKTFAQVLESKQTLLARDEAEYGLAMSLLKGKYYLAALKYFEDVVARGEDNSYFARAVEGVLEASLGAGGELLVAQLLDGIYDKSGGALAKVKPALLQHIHYMIASRALRSGRAEESADFAGSIERRHSDYARAQYVMGLGKLDKYEEAIAHFNNARADQALGSLSTLAIARLHYERAFAMEASDANRAGVMKKAIAEYDAIPRFSSMWADALFEKAWAYAVLEDYGRALGALHSLEHPYFNDVFYPEADVLRAIAFWRNCKWQNVNKTLAKLHQKYVPIVEPLKSLLASPRDGQGWYDLLTGQDQSIPRPIWLRVTKDRQYDVFTSLLTQIESERQRVAMSQSLQDSKLAQDMLRYLDNSKQDLQKTAGKWAQSRVKRMAREIDDILTKASIISLETKTAEAKWLQGGKRIDGLVAENAPRPYVNEDTRMFWWESQNERWIDELGYYQYAIQSQCNE